MEVDRNVPIPDRARRRLKYPWDKMKVGDSLLVNGVVRSVPISAAKQWAKRHKKTYEFTARKENGGIRIWRIK